MTSRVPRLRALDDTIITTLRSAAPGRLSTAEVALACGEYDVIRDTICNGDHTVKEQYGWRFLSCTPDLSRVTRGGLRGDCEPVIHVYRHRHDSQTIGPRLDQLRRAGRVDLYQLANSRYWSIAVDLDVRLEIAELDAALKMEFRHD